MINKTKITIIEGSLESMVMEIVWDKGVCSPKDVLNNLKGEYALTTISTVLERLYEKGFLEKSKASGKVTYNPKITEKIYSETIVKQFMNKIVTSFGDLAISSFAKGIEQLSDEKRKELIELLKKYEK